MRAPRRREHELRARARGVLKGVEAVREQLGRIGLVGYGWDSPPHWVSSMRLEQAYFADTEIIIPSGSVTGPNGLHLPYGPNGPTVIAANTTLTNDVTLVGLRRYSA